MREQPDYRALIDQQVWDFIERTERWYPVDTVLRSIDEQRSVYTAMCREFSNDHPEGVQSTDSLVALQAHAVPVRRYSSVNINARTDAHIIYAHGGGFVVGDLNSHDDVCAELCAITGFGVTSIDYRLSPEHKHPAAFNDCLLVTQFEANRLGVPLLLCGDSAGGNLCAAVSHRLRDSENRIPVIGQVLIYPQLGGDHHKGSYTTHANAPMLSKDEVDYYLYVRVNDALPDNDTSFAPLHDSDFSNLPPTLVLSAECDPLCDDGRHYCQAINHAGGKAQWRNEKGLVHGYLRARHTSTRAKESFRVITDGLSAFAHDKATK